MWKRHHDHTTTTTNRKIRIRSCVLKCSIKPSSQQPVHMLLSFIGAVQLCNLTAVTQLKEEEFMHTRRLDEMSKSFMHSTTLLLHIAYLSCPLQQQERQEDWWRKERDECGIRWSTYYEGMLHYAYYSDHLSVIHRAAVLFWQRHYTIETQRWASINPTRLLDEKGKWRLFISSTVHDFEAFLLKLS